MLVPQMPDHVPFAQLGRATRTAHADFVFDLLANRFDGRRMAEPLFELLQFLDGALLAGLGDIRPQYVGGERPVFADRTH